MNESSPFSSPIVLGRHDSPVGPLEIHARRTGITRLHIVAPAPLTPTTADAPHDVVPRAARPEADQTALEIVDEARRQLDDYFDRVRLRFDLPLDSIGTAFQDDVWEALGRVPWGTATSYGALAEETGRPLGARAVGGAVRANPIAIIVPCHRVLGAGARLTGYSPGRGVETKKWLLDHEGIDYVA
jgi:methylated-DNA-[protein]-cysteine S-methyltransferase